MRIVNHKLELDVYTTDRGPFRQTWIGDDQEINDMANLQQGLYETFPTEVYKVKIFINGNLFAEIV